MSTNLRDIRFSFRDDIIEELNRGLLNDSAVNTQGGNDVLKGIDSSTPVETDTYGIRNTATGRLTTSWGNDLLVGAGRIGIENAGIIETGVGNDSIEAKGGGNGLANLPGALIDLSHGDDSIVASGSVGLINSAGARILAGTGNDSIIADGNWGLQNSGLIDMDHGDDVIRASGGPPAGLTNDAGTILMGTGNDWIQAGGKFGAVQNINNALIDTGFGNDRVTGGSNSTGVANLDSSTLLTGGGDDAIVGLGGLAGIANQGLIDMGFGNDVLTGYSVIDSFFTSSTNIGVGIDNTGYIDMGGGDDVVRGIGGSLRQGIVGGGTVNLGSGNDRFSAFGNQVLEGGFGFDVLLLDGSFDAELKLNLPSFSLGGSSEISLGSLPNSFVFSFRDPLSGGLTEMTVMNFEEFRLSGTTFLAQDLRTMLGG